MKNRLIEAVVLLLYMVIAGYLILHTLIVYANINNRPAVAWCIAALAGASFLAGIGMGVLITKSKK